MSESDTPRFTRLNDANYAEWALRMEAVLIRKGLWLVVDVIVPNADAKDDDTVELELQKLLKARTASKMAEARAELILRVEDSQLSHMRQSDPREIWLTLQRVHRASGFATSLALRRLFLTMKKSDPQSMQAWIGEVKALEFRMEEAGIDVSEQDIILALTMGLPAAFDPVIINFDSTPSDQLTLDHVIGRLLNEETRQKSTATLTRIRVKKEEPQEEAMLATGTGRWRGSNFSASNVTCFFCDQKGHIKTECQEKKEWERLKTEKEKGGVAAAVFCDSESDDEVLLTV